MQVFIPFLDQFKPKLLDGSKTMTSRNKKYGHPEDTFYIGDAMFSILEVKKVTLGYVAFNCYKAEGCDSVDEFIEIWNKIHPRKTYHHDTDVFLHEFKRVL